MGRLRLESSQHPQRLRIALEPADVSCDLVQRCLTVVAERRMPEVMCEAGGVDDVGVTAESLAQLAADLRDLEGMGQPVSDEVVRARRDDLRLGSESTQRCGVDYSRAVTFEGRPIRPLRRLRGPPVAVAVLVIAQLGRSQRLSLPPARPAWTEALPASRRAIGTRNGEHDT